MISDSKDQKWMLYSLLVIFLIFFYILLGWPLLPKFLDIYYHLSVAQGFDRAGGFTVHDFMQYAPGGRPHLYPPLFQLLILFLMKLIPDSLTIGRLMDLLIFPLFLVTIWFFIRSLFYERLAFFTVLIAASFYSFYLSSSNFIPVTICFIFGLLSLLALEKKRFISSVLLLSLTFYTHAQIPWFFLLAYIVYAVLSKKNLRITLSIVVLSLLFAAPIIFYLLKNIHFYKPALAYENFILEFNLLLILAVFSFRKIFREKHSYYLLISLTIAALPFIFSYPYRYLSGQGLLGLILLASLGIDNIYNALTRYFIQPKKEKFRALLTISIFVFLIIFSPTISISRSREVKFLPFNSTYFNLISLDKDIQRSNEQSVTSSKFISELVGIVKENSEEEDIIFSNLDFIGTMLAALTMRADSRGMLNEVPPPLREDPISNAKLIIWFKDPEGKIDPELAKVVSGYKLIPIAETEIAYVYKNSFTTAVVRGEKADISESTLIVIILLLGSLLAYDLFLRKRLDSKAL